MDCGDLVADLIRRIESGENLDLIAADLEYGVRAELEEFARILEALLTEAVVRRTTMIEEANTTAGLSAAPTQAKFIS